LNFKSLRVIWLEFYTILAKYYKCDLEVLIPAAYFHDIALLFGYPKENHAKKSAEITREILKDFPKVEKICKVIEEHSFNLNKKPSCIESALLQDADRLDMGAIGIYRSIAYGVLKGRAFYDITDPFALNRELDDEKYTIDHFFKKILKIESTLNTKVAKRIWRKRVKIIINFLKCLAYEIGVKNKLKVAFKKHKIFYPLWIKQFFI